MKLKKLLVRFGTLSGIIDMLRYDCCWPATEDDSRTLQRAQPGACMKRTALDHIVRLYSVGADAPTFERWESFGCQVLAVGEKKVDAEMDRLTQALREEPEPGTKPAKRRRS